MFMDSPLNVFFLLEGLLYSKSGMTQAPAVLD